MAERDKDGFKRKTGVEMKTDVSSINSIPSKAVFTDVECLSKGYAGHNLDYVWFCYTEDRLMLMEEKRYGKQQLSRSQRITQGIMDTALRFACENGCRFMNGERETEIEYHGYHVITFQKTNPEDGWTKIDDEKVSIEQLLSFLRFETP